MATPDDNRPRLRPLSLGEILDVSIKICLAHWRTLLKAVFILLVPVQILSTFLTADYTISSLDFDTNADQTAQESLDELNQYIGGIVASTLLQVLALLLAIAACFRAIAQAYLGEPTDWRSSLRYALRRGPALLSITLLYVLGVGIGSVLLLAPGVWLYVAWAFAMPVLLVEGLRGRAALRRSFGLVRGRWWRTFGVILVGFILATIVGGLVQAVFVVGVFVNADNDALVLGLNALGGLAGLAITTPFQAALLTVLYFDLRVRKEGFDLELLAREIGANAPAALPIGPTPTEPAPAPATSVPSPTSDPGGQHWPAPPGWRAPASGGDSDRGGGSQGDDPDRGGGSHGGDSDRGGGPHGDDPDRGGGSQGGSDRGDDDGPRLPGVPYG